MLEVIMNNALLVSMLYLFASVVVFLVFFATSRAISGRRFKVAGFWLFFVLAMLWGMVQLNVARQGYIYFFPSSKVIIEGNHIVRWVAFISAVLQAVCIPTREKPRRFLSQK